MNQDFQNNQEPQNEQETPAANAQPVLAKKKIYQKWWFWVIVAVCGIVMISAMLGDDSAEEKSPEKGSTTASTTQEEEPVLQVDEETYKSQCEAISYFNLAHYPDRYVGNDIKFRGLVRQVIEDGNQLTILMDIVRDEYGFYDKTVYVTYTRKSTDPRILEEDMITVYGTYNGMISYTTVSYTTETVPGVSAKFVKLG